MSLVDEPLCRETTPLLVAELKRNTSPAVRANAMLALSDIAAIQTMLVDVHMKDITVAVRDPHPLLRKQALSLLAGLLQKEFLKWRGPLFVQYAPPLSSFGCPLTRVCALVPVWLNSPPPRTTLPTALFVQYALHLLF
jgi:hypothetical protein